MSIPDIVIVTVLLAALGGALYYIYRSKKKGRTCIGCPYADSCCKKQCDQ